MGVCKRCGCVQKRTDANWYRHIQNIYAEYSIYRLSGGKEQIVFDPESGTQKSRSFKFLEHVFDLIKPGTTGRLLDVGCGNGALLRAFSCFAPNWSLSGIEKNDMHKSNVEALENVDSFYTCSPLEVTGNFNIISLIHVLEHIPNPLEFLKNLFHKLIPDGILLIEVPDYSQNPVDLLICDHCFHFTLKTLSFLLHQSGYEILSARTDWIPKEISIIARKSGIQNITQFKSCNYDPVPVLNSPVEWLKSALSTAQNLSSEKSFGVFGTSIAAAWLYGQLNGSIDFFVDDDQDKTGKMMFGKPIFSANNVPSSSHVLIALPDIIAKPIKRRIDSSKFLYKTYTVNL